MVYGTPEYMAPEQALGQPVDARADLYALGVMSFEMIAGARPFSHESKVTLLGMHVTAPIPKLSARAPEANVPAEIDELVTRLLAKDAADRFGDARELIDALDAVSAKLAAGGRIASTLGPSSLVQPPRAAGGRASEPDGSSPSVIAVGPTRWAEVTPSPTGSRWASAVSARWRERVGVTLRSALAAIPPRARSRRAAIVAGAFAMLVLVIGVISRREGGTPQVGAQPAGAGVSVIPPPPASETRIDAVVGTAQAVLERGDFATAIDTLTAIEKKEPDRADVHRLLERAFTGVRNARDAMREARLWLAADPNGAADLKLQEDVRNAALLKDAQDEAFSLLESKMGARGIDILYDIAFGASGRLYPQAAQRAKHSLDQTEVRGRAAPALAVLLDFRDAKTCEEKHDLLERARDDGDSRLIPILQPYATARGCGFLGRSDCYPCMHRDHLVAEAMTAIQDRIARAAP
jgi:serine/threonine-protein kinase